MNISVVIPVLNESLQIRKTLELLINHASKPQALEVIVVDGGSKDQTVDEVYAFAKANLSINIKLKTSEKGRARQLATGAEHAQEAILYFLHADSYPPENYDLLITKAVSNGNPAGCFRMRFRCNHIWLRFICWFTRFNWRASRGGDQSQYITRELYDEIGGYDSELPIYEDYDLIHKLYDREAFHVLPATLTSSSRRYHEQGVLRLQWHYLKIYWKKWRGASNEDILSYYRANCT